MDVVEDEHQRLMCSQPLQEPTDRAVAEVALPCELDASDSRDARHGGKDPAQGSEDVVTEHGEEGGIEPVHVLVERVDEDRERHVALELGRRAVEHQVAARIGPRAELGEQSRLADARLADQPGVPPNDPRRGRRGCCRGPRFPRFCRRNARNSGPRRRIDPGSKRRARRRLSKKRSSSRVRWPVLLQVFVRLHVGGCSCRFVSFCVDTCRLVPPEPRSDSVLVTSCVGS